jgi:EAL domain-containing protein (putative c-di-GMP-specific phosphodiesterase class I)
MSVGIRLGTLGAVGVVVAGMAHAGWLWLSWAAADGAAGLPAPWLPLAAQAGLTVALAAAVGWQLHRAMQPLQHSLDLLREQVDALEQGRFVIVEDPPLAETVPLAHSLNAAVRHLQSALEHTPAASTRALRRAARSDADTGLDSRFTFVRRLTESLAERPSGEAALLTLRLLPQAPGLPVDPQALADGAELLRAYPQRVAGAFVGRVADSDLALCLPAHGVVEDCAASLMAAARAAPGRLRCVIGCVDHLGGVSLGSALALLDLATTQAECAGVGQIDSRSARDDSVGADDGVARRQIVDALRGARLTLGEFPVVDGEGRLLHLECPMRLRLRPEGPFEPAEAWLVVATRYRLMTQIDLSGLELALTACAADGRPRCVHVAAESLSTAGFVSAVRARLEAAPEAAARLWIEIAEVSFERLPPRLRNAGTVWRRCGARVGIEHAGAALRSLVRLSELDLDYVKVDRSFVHGVATDPAQRERALGLVAFVHELGARVIAEGVDDDTDLETLWSLGFDGATGRAASRQHRDSLPAADDQAMSPA